MQFPVTSSHSPHLAGQSMLQLPPATPLYFPNGHLQSGMFILLILHSVQLVDVPSQREHLLLH